MRPPYTKHDAVEELIARLQGEGEQVIVMSCFNQPLTNLHNSLSRTGVYTSAVISGETTLQERTRLIRRFQQAELDILLVNKRAAAHGLNLQKCSNWPGGASHIIHMDRWWSPAVERQANGRIVRMNTLYPCTAHYFEVENSMDTAMRDLVQAKADGINMMDAELIKTTMERNQLG
jgi:SNF2 family DNA or RNA helicase